MAKIGVTYVAPKGDSEVVEMQGVKFFSGQTVKIDEDKQERLLSKLRKNPHFRVDDKKPKEPAGGNAEQAQSEAQAGENPTE